MGETDLSSITQERTTEEFGGEGDRRSSVVGSRWMAIPTWILAVTFAGLASAARAEPGDAETIIEALDAAVEQWRSEVVFRSTFRYREGVAVSAERGLHGEIKRPPSGELYTATGVFHKRGGQLRFSLDYGAPPVDASPERDGSVVSHVSFDETTTGPLELTYLPRYGDTGDDVTIWKRTDRLVGKPVAGPYASSCLSPLSLYDEDGGHPLRTYDVKGDGEVLEKDIVETDQEHIEVILTLKSKEEWTETRRVVFWTAPSPPVIERIATTSLTHSSGRCVEAIAEASKFVKCPGGMVARAVRLVLGPFEPGGFWMAREWVSDDLGKRPPSNRDFVVTIPKSVHVNGIRSAPSPGRVREIDLTKYSVDDLDLGLIDAVGAVDTASRWSWPRVLLAVLSVIVISILLGISAWRRWTGSPA